MRADPDLRRPPKALGARRPPTGRTPAGAAPPYRVARIGAFALRLSLLALVAAEACLFLADTAVARYAAALPPDQVRIWAIVTSFGTSGYMFAVSAAVALSAALVRRRTRHPERRRYAEILMGGAGFFFGCIAASGIAAQGVKHVVGRMRPKFLADVGAFDILGPTLHRGADSFPSGHTTSAFAAAMALGMMAPRLRAPLLGAACLIGMSRITTGNHYPSDVLAGAVLGAGTSWMVATALARRGMLFREAGDAPAADRA